MSSTDSHAKNRGKKLTAAEKREAHIAANRKARMQWYVLGAVLAIAILVTVILIAVYTEGEIAVPT